MKEGSGSPCRRCSPDTEITRHQDLDDQDDGPPPPPWLLALRLELRGVAAQVLQRPVLAAVEPEDARQAVPGT